MSYVTEGLAGSDDLKMGMPTSSMEQAYISDPGVINTIQQAKPGQSGVTARQRATKRLVERYQAAAALAPGAAGATGEGVSKSKIAMVAVGFVAVAILLTQPKKKQ